MIVFWDVRSRDGLLGISKEFQRVFRKHPLLKITETIYRNNKNRFLETGFWKLVSGNLFIYY